VNPLFIKRVHVYIYIYIGVIFASKIIIYAYQKNMSQPMNMIVRTDH
jgi:hypothetical protein